MPKSNLLARFANNAFWLGRYLERAENLARLLDINETYDRETASGPNWKHVLDLYADTERFSESYEAPNAESVLNFYIRD
ncbi:MAG: alpha-E domain-containing protein, partial [Desulfuromonadales bacterium]|nr:alpha-E domain-containing protein [Desulfuromonadales bacterium]